MGFLGVFGQDRMPISPQSIYGSPIHIAHRLLRKSGSPLNPYQLSIIEGQRTSEGHCVSLGNWLAIKNYDMHTWALCVR